MKVTVYFNNGCVLECPDVVDRRRFWRLVSKWCKHTNRSKFFNAYCNKPMRVERVVFDK